MSTQQIEKVKIDELVILKILKHARSSEDKETLGQLHGFFDNNTLEIDHCYPLADPARISISQSDYDHQMAKLSEEVRLTNNRAGWYHVSYKADNFVAFDSLEQQALYQTANPHSVYLVYDMMASQRGVENPFKAYRLGDEFLELYEQKSAKPFETSSISSKSTKVFQPVPVEIVRNPLASAFIGLYRKDISKKYEAHVHPSINVSSTLQKNSHYLNEALEQLHEANYQANFELLKKFKDPKAEKQEVDPTKAIDNLLLAERVHKLTDNIIEQSKFVSESTAALKHIC